MATKKKATGKKKLAPTTPASDNVFDLVLKLTEVECLKLSRYDSDQRAAINEHALLKHKKDQYLKQIDPQGILASFDRELAKSKADVKEAEDLGKAVRTEIESRLNIQLINYSFDDKTGVLHHLTSAPEATEKKEI